MKRFLVVCTAFAPENAIGAVRVSKLVKYLVRDGHAVTVISPELGPGVQWDMSLECPELARTKRITVPQSAAFDRLVAGWRRDALRGGSGVDLVRPGAHASIVQTLKAGVFRNARFVYSILRNLDWRRQVIARAKSEGDLGTFDVVFSSYPSLGGMWAAADLRRFGVAGRWIADFRDPVNYRTGAGALAYWSNSWIQRRLLRQADAVVAVSHGVAAKLLPRDPGAVTVVYNGFDPEDVPPAAAQAAGLRDNVRLQLCYTGSLYGGARDISVVFAALRELADAGSISLGKVRFAYAGGDFPALALQARRHGLDGILVDLGRLPRSAALQLLSDSDLAVVATWNTPEEQGIMTGKLFECFMVRTPVLGVVNGTLAGSEFARVIVEVGAGFVHEEAAAGNELGPLSQFLMDHYSARAAGSGAASRYRDAVLDYSYPRLAATLSSLA